jgi:hypothetical protein
LNKNERGKPCANQKFFIPLESSQNLDIKSELAHLEIGEWLKEGLGIKCRKSNL